MLHAPSRVMTHSEQNQSPSGMESSFGCGGESTVLTVQTMLVIMYCSLFLKSSPAPVFDWLQYRNIVHVWKEYRVLPTSEGI